MAGEQRKERDLDAVRDKMVKLSAFGEAEPTIKRSISERRTVLF